MCNVCIYLFICRTFTLKKKRRIIIIYIQVTLQLEMVSISIEKTPSDSKIEEKELVAQE